MWVPLLAVKKLDWVSCRLPPLAYSSSWWIFVEALMYSRYCALWGRQFWPGKAGCEPCQQPDTLGWRACWELGGGCLHWGASARGWWVDNEWACYCTGGLEPTQCQQVPLSLSLPSVFIGSARLARAPFLSVFALKAVCRRDPPRTSWQWECPLCAWAFSSGCGPPGPPSAFICFVSGGTRDSGAVSMVCRCSQDASFSIGLHWLLRVFIFLHVCGKEDTLAALSPETHKKHCFTAVFSSSSWKTLC